MTSTKLVKAINKIDHKASKYVWEQMIKNNLTDESDIVLAEVFFWSESPQGKRYWIDIDNKLKGA